jgi:hypothetical protein
VNATAVWRWKALPASFVSSLRSNALAFVGLGSKLSNLDNVTKPSSKRCDPVKVPTRSYELNPTLPCGPHGYKM